jgi:hypothetical protein
MWRIVKQVTDGEGTHRWQGAGPERFATREDAQRGATAACRAFLASPGYHGLRCVRFRAALASVAACLVLQ